MSLAYLIQAHDQPQMLARLVSRLAGADTHFFLHIDRSVDVAPFVGALSGQVNIHWARQRVKVRWMGFSQVKATLSLMRLAADTGEFSYYSLLSGTDYPIKSNNQIQQFWQATRPST